MENISENKRKRGRPEKDIYYGVSKTEVMSEYKKIGIFDNVRSERAKINMCYQFRAHGLLKDDNDECPIDGEFAFIISAEGLNPIVYKKTILQELGRLEDEDLLREVARQICKYRLSTSRAITYIRLHRIEKQMEGDSFNLAVEIGSIIDSYMLRHSDVDMSLIESSLSTVYNAFSEKFSNNTNT